MHCAWILFSRAVLSLRGCHFERLFRSVGKIRSSRQRIALVVNYDGRSGDPYPHFPFQRDSRKESDAYVPLQNYLVSNLIHTRIASVASGEH